MMIEQILSFLENLGIIGLFAVIFLEGSSLPFPGVILVLSYGGILDLSVPETAAVSAGMAIVYSLASLIPYYLGDKAEKLVQKKFRKGMERASRLFNKYGIWSIAISRPFGIGNYISYLAGISKIRIGSYMVLTFSGIFPWCFAILYLGHVFNGNYEAFLEFYEGNQFFLYAVVLLIVILCLTAAVYRSRKKQVDN